jgi:hypothetical protein
MLKRTNTAITKRTNTAMTKRTNNVGSDRQAVSKTTVFRFITNGELILASNITCPVTLQAASFDGAIPALVELTPDSDQSEIAFRVGFTRSYLNISVGNKEFTARIARRLKNAPLLWLHAADVFAGLFPVESRS